MFKRERRKILRLYNRRGFQAGLCHALVFMTVCAHAAPRVETFDWDAVGVTISVNPPLVDLAQDTEVAITLTHPENVTVTLPAELSDRFEGFTVEGRYDTGTSAGSVAQKETHLRLKPAPAAERFRIKPISVEISDSATHPPTKSWHPTRAMVLERAGGDAPETVSTDIAPQYIRPSFRNAPKVVLYALGAVAALALLFVAGSAIRTRRRIRRMSPRERALLELKVLASRKLPEKGLFKDFYVELTMVVRRYIERRYGIRAPEQTTEEFVEAVKTRPDFPFNAVKQLRPFLASADLIKFAGVSATADMAAEATTKAKAYIESDEPRAKEGA